MKRKIPNPNSDEFSFKKTKKDQKYVKNKNIRQFLEKNIKTSSVSSPQIIKDKLEGRVIMLDNPSTEITLRNIRQKRRNRLAHQKIPKLIKKKGNRELMKSHFNISSSGITYELFLPIHQLWKAYIHSLIQDFAPNFPSSINDIFLKIDYHGAQLKVIKSVCPHYIGLEGLVINETKNTFVIISQDNHIRTIPKYHNIFVIPIENQELRINGSAFILRSSERSVKKFKIKASEKSSKDIFLH